MRGGSRERVRARIRGRYVDSNLITEAAVRASERKCVCVCVKETAEEGASRATGWMNTRSTAHAGPGNIKRDVFYLKPTPVGSTPKLYITIQYAHRSL